MKRLFAVATLVATLLATALVGVPTQHSYDQLYCDTPTITATSTCWTEMTTYYA
jgi:hypothetical protein